jgi:hypothetical protein
LGGINSFGGICVILLFLGMAVAIAEPTTTPPITLSQTQLDSISKHCGSPRKWLQNRAGVIHLQPNRNAKYERVDCVLDELKQWNAGPMGFVGNEAPR